MSFVLCAFKKGVLHGQESKKNGEEENQKSREEIRLRLQLPLGKRGQAPFSYSKRCLTLQSFTPMTTSLFTQCPVLFEDEDLLVINKPEGVLSHPNPGAQSSASALPTGRQAFEGPYDLSDRRFQTPRGPVWLIHRLDQDTSGVLLAAKNKKSAAACRAAFEQRKVKKDYLALVSRRPMPAHGTWRDSLVERRAGGGIRAAIHSSGRPNAFLKYKMKEYFPKSNLSLLEIELLTGKTHQIRVQSAYRGHPVAGDRTYGNFALNKELKAALGLRRMFLHAWRLVLPHPTSGKPVTIESPLPEDLENCLLRTR